jgi:hypothetical protein
LIVKQDPGGGAFQIIILARTQRPKKTNQANLINNCNMNDESASGTLTTMKLDNASRTHFNV